MKKQTTSRRKSVNTPPVNEQPIDTAVRELKVDIDEKIQVLEKRKSTIKEKIINSEVKRLKSTYSIKSGVLDIITKIFTLPFLSKPVRMTIGALCGVSAFLILFGLAKLVPVFVLLFVVSYMFVKSFFDNHGE